MKKVKNEIKNWESFYLEKLNKEKSFKTNKQLSDDVMTGERIEISRKQFSEMNWDDLLKKINKDFWWDIKEWMEVLKAKLKLKSSFVLNDEDKRKEFTEILSDVPKRTPIKGDELWNM